MKIRPEKIQACTGIEPMTSAIPVQRSTNRANKPTGSCALFAVLDVVFSYGNMAAFLGVNLRTYLIIRLPGMRLFWYK